MPTPRKITWENFRRHMLEPAIPATLSLGGEPALQLFVTERAERIGLRAPVDASAVVQPSPVRQIAMRLVRDGGTTLLEVSTTCSELYREFFFLALSMADLIREEKVPAPEAIESCIVAWRSLLRSATRLPDEEVLGLIGELWVLARLLRASGPHALRSWTAPARDPHDFRLGGVELEVKVTRKATRIHMISGLTQLVPSEGASLFLVSLQMEPAGGNPGTSLPGSIAEVRDLLGHSPVELDRFADLLARRSKYSEAEADLYQEAYRLRTPAVLVPVDDSCPRLTPAMAGQVLGSGLAPRLHRVMYEIDVDGLGFMDGTPGFDEVIPDGRC